MRTIIDEGQRLRSLLTSLDYPAGDVLGEYVAQLTKDDHSAAAAAAGQGAPSEDSAAIAEGSSALTKRELEILSLLERAMSNERIALNISIKTNGI